MKEQRKIKDIVAVDTKWLTLFLPMALSAFTDTFGLTELKKGFFPHFFHTPSNQHNCGFYHMPGSTQVVRISRSDGRPSLVL